MNYNRKRHKVLKSLSESRIKFDSGTGESGWKLGVGFDTLCKSLKCDREKLEVILSELYLNKDIEYTNVDVDEVFSTQQGLVTFASKKYIKENNKLILNWLKNFNQILIPVLSLIIAIVALTIKFNSIQKEIENNLSEKYLIQIDDLQNQIDSLKKNDSQNIKQNEFPKDTVN
ncbi:hypothetical protein [uncultured Psychroserpens sp.]|uniref:hypothetical protein n=1 Tax=uncultured Psychroserpens sp. TaxID=255436 RepID=UPI002616F075|nr:hypothetical protein [uncultured Psychroserpens sp.]